ncbi:WD40-repeat-containing domain protein [Boletus edulis BED1]|uniref:WD40-repeat-containing domain protein n=1 Tax=Boletus edulis BED1 TaxID=1328754 RepID=A0AAD4GHJ6_BOLED|nr:WD40-repeat-containing domain protein [Boletus edulis BED1]
MTTNEPEPRRWRWSPLTDSSTSLHPPIFTRDGSHFFSIVGSTIKIYSATSGKIISTLPGSQDHGHTDIITSAVLSPQNAFQLITASLDGTIKIWDFLEGVLLRTIGLDQPIHHVCTHEKIKDHLFVAAVKNKKSDSPEKAQRPSQVVPIGKTRTTAGLAVSASGERLIAIAGHKAYVAPISNLKSGFTKFVSPEPLTCLAVHPFEDYFATGDAKGVVRLWYCLDPKLVKVVGVEKKSQTSMLHWHAHAVSSVAFTTNGAYLLSGGEESVLVIWQLHSGKREFVPRVSSPITNIVVSPSRLAEEEYLLGLADASYAFVSSATLKLSRVFARIKLDPLVSNCRPSSSSTPLAFHQPSETLVLPSSHPSSLQTYSPSTFTLLGELEVSPSNRVSRREDKVLEPARVERAVISSCGEWMATIDRRESDENFRGEIYLKFWYWDKKLTFWILNTRIDRPHGLAKVTSLSFRPGVEDAQVVTTGEDGNMKAWRIRRMRNKKGSEEVSWTSRSSFSLRSDIPRHTSWSHDGSLLAVPIGGSIVIYDPNTNAVRESFVIQECRQPFEAHFIGRSGRYLGVIGGEDLVVWDVLSQSVTWHQKNQYRFTMLVSHPYHDTFITIHSTVLDFSSSSVTLFRATSPIPLMEYTLPFGVLNVSWFYQSSLPLSNDFSLVALTHKYDVVVMGDNVILLEDPGASAKAVQKCPAAPRRSLFEEMFGVPAITSLGNPNEQTRETMADLGSGDGVTVPWRSSDTTNFFDAPSHLMPPIETFFEPLIDSFLRLRTTDDESSAAQAVAEAEDDMPVDPTRETDPVNVSAVSNEAILDVFVPLFQEIADAPGYAYRTDKTIAPSKAINGTSENHTKPISQAPTKNSVRSEIRLSPDQSAPPITTKTGEKRSRASLG